MYLLQKINKKYLHDQLWLRTHEKRTITQWKERCKESLNSELAFLFGSLHGLTEKLKCASHQAQWCGSKPPQLANSSHVTWSYCKWRVTCLLELGCQGLIRAPAPQTPGLVLCYNGWHDHLSNRQAKIMFKYVLMYPIGIWLILYITSLNGDINAHTYYSPASLNSHISHLISHTHKYGYTYTDTSLSSCMRHSLRHTSVMGIMMPGGWDPCCEHWPHSVVRCPLSLLQTRAYHRGDGMVSTQHTGITKKAIHQRETVRLKGGEQTKQFDSENPTGPAVRRSKRLRPDISTLTPQVKSSEFNQGFKCKNK